MPSVALADLPGRCCPIAAPYANMTAARQFLDRMFINPGDKEKIAHLNAERLIRL
jgi:predicted TIM-barrel fold metal-dependent hydrolase